MWFNERTGQPDWQDAERHLRTADPVLPRLMEQVGPCTLAPLSKPFPTLVLSIFSQQLSVKGAETLYGRFRERLPGKRVTPANVLSALHGEAAWDEETIRHCGLSRQKRAYLIDLARHVADRRLPLAKLAGFDDETVIEKLTAVKGIGVWTAQMYLMFTLCRPDVLPVADLGLQEAAKRSYGLTERPKAAELTALAEPWRPYRTIATWYLWRGKEG